MFYDLEASGARIRLLRKQKGFTQETLAEVLNIDRSYISLIEVGKKGCSVDLFVQLADLFDVSLDYLIVGKTAQAGVPVSELGSLSEEAGQLADQLHRFCQMVNDKV